MNNRIRELRSELGWSQEHLAQQLEVSRQTIISIERGKYDPSLPLAFKISAIYKQAIEEIFVPDTNA